MPTSEKTEKSEKHDASAEHKRPPNPPADPGERHPDTGLPKHERPEVAGQTATSEQKSRDKERDPLKFPQPGDIFAVPDNANQQTGDEESRRKVITVRLISDDRWIHYLAADGGEYLIHANMWEDFARDAKVLHKAPPATNLTFNASLDQYDAAEIRERTRVMRARHEPVSDLGRWVSRDQGPNDTLGERYVTPTVSTPGQAEAHLLSDEAKKEAIAHGAPDPDPSYKAAEKAQKEQDKEQAGDDRPEREKYSPGPGETRNDPAGSTAKLPHHKNEPVEEGKEKQERDKQEKDRLEREKKK